MRRFGIDLGTTNTLVYEAYFPTGTPDIEEFQLSTVNIQYKNTGSLLGALPSMPYMPSVVYGRKAADGEDLEFFLGTVAKMMANNDSNPVIINTKRLLSREDTRPVLPFGLTARDIAQKLLEGCRYSIESKHGNASRKLQNAKYCITQPAAFGPFASLSIRDAAVPAGFERHEVLREPIAALLSFLYDKLMGHPDELFEKQKAHNDRLLTLVVDIGGGTTDVTIQEIAVRGTEEAVQGLPYCTGYRVDFLNQTRPAEDTDSPVASANTEPAFGGLDFDREIVQYIRDTWDEQFFQKRGHSFDWQSLQGQLLTNALYGRVEDFKIRLHTSADTIYLEEFEVLDELPVSCKISSDEFYRLTQPLCERPLGREQSGRTVYGIIQDTIQRSGYSIDDVDYMYVTGGMSNYRPIRDMLKRHFKQLDDRGSLVFSKSPLDDIAKGAALCDCFFEVKMPQAFLYADLMLDDPNGSPRILVNKNTPLPLKNQVLENFTRLSNPVSIYVDVLWGTGPNDCRLRRLRRLSRPLPDYRVAPIGTNISVKYSIDTHQAIDMELLIHAPDGDFTISLIKLIQDFNLSEGGDS